MYLCNIWPMQWCIVGQLVLLCTRLSNRCLDRQVSTLGKLFTVLQSVNYFIKTYTQQDSINPFYTQVDFICRFCCEQNTKNYMNIKLLIPRNEHVRHSPYYTGCKTWNSLPLEVREMDQITFKTEVKNRIKNNQINLLF